MKQSVHVPVRHILHAHSHLPHIAHLHVVARNKHSTTGISGDASGDASRPPGAMVHVLDGSSVNFTSVAWSPDVGSVSCGYRVLLY